MKTGKCTIILEKYCEETLERIEKQKEEKRIYKPTDEEIREGWGKFFKEFSKKDISKSWTLKELREFVKNFNNGLGQITALIRLFDNKFVNEVVTPWGNYLIEKTIFDFIPSIEIRKSETGDYKIGIDNGFIVICKKEMVIYFCCGPLITVWKVIKAIDPADVKIKKFDHKNCSLEIQILCPNCKKTLIT